jgi:ParB family chromosome partitioning protein
MAQSKSRLGRGLGGLIASGGKTPANKDSASTPAKKTAVSVAAAPPKTSLPPISGYREIPLKSLRRSPFQPRREIAAEAVGELARSIQSEGLLQPIVVRAVDDGFELIAGERRWRAFEKLGQKAIPARIIEATDASAAALALIENLQREGLNPIDEALGYASLVRDFDLTQEAVAERVGKARASVANALRLLTLGTEIQGYLSRKLISVGHAKVLLGLDESAHQKLLARRIVETGMSVRDAEQQVKRLRDSNSTRKRPTSGAPASAEDESTALKALEKRLGEFLNTRVAIKHSAKQGRVMIDYFDNDDLDRILDRIGLPPS